MHLENAVEEYHYHCLSKGFTPKTMINKKQEHKNLLAFLGDKRGIQDLKAITRHDIQAYIRFRQQSGLKAQSLNTVCKLIGAFFNWCVYEDYLESSPMEKVAIPKIPFTVIKDFTDDDVIKMIEYWTTDKYLELRNKAIIAMIADTGLRAMEIRTLTIQNIRDISILVNGKGNKERVVFISPVLKRILIKYERLRKSHFKDRLSPSDNYFLNYMGNGMSHVSLDRIVKEAGKRAKVTGKRISPHTFRHYYAVTAINSGNIDIYTLSRLLGHSDISTTQRYLNSMTDSQIELKAMSASPLIDLGRRK